MKTVKQRFTALFGPENEWDFRIDVMCVMMMLGCCRFSPLPSSAIHVLLLVFI